MSKKDELLKLFINYCIVAFLGIFAILELLSGYKKAPLGDIAMSSSGLTRGSLYGILEFP